jgi:hypothetical protein
MKQLDNLDQTKPSDLEVLLQESGIDLSLWGKGEAKTLGHLQKEINEGETNLVKDNEGKLLRKVLVGGTDVFYTSSEGKKFKLKEEKQVFKDGRERRRDLGQAVLEKIKPDEDPKEAMIRGVKEELGIEGDLEMLDKGTEEKYVMSPSYPGLQSQYVRFKFEITLDDNQFNPDGYIENQADKSTYFIWEEIN